tara:strand:- start:687 stop:1352 length:666 start_codon:yes stop_codon:yes gene_type:complete
MYNKEKALQWRKKNRIHLQEYCEETKEHRNHLARIRYTKRTSEQIIHQRKYNKQFQKKRITTDEEKIKHSKQNKILLRTKKLMVYNHYSNWNIQCCCCGEKEIEFLSIDHKFNNGAEHRKKVCTSNILNWIIKNNYPPLFQIMCMNCNFAKGKKGNNGICPHKKKENLNYLIIINYIMCFIDAAMVFYPIAIGSLSFISVKLYRKYKETKQKTDTQPATIQ